MSAIHLAAGFALCFVASGTAPCALPCACLGIAPGRMLGGLALGFAASATAPHALVSVFLGIASRRRLGGVAPPRDASLLVRAKSEQKRAKGRSPLWHPPFGAAGQRPEESRAGSFVKQSAASARRTHPVWRKRQPGLPVGAADVPSSRFVQIPRSALAPIRHLSRLWRDPLG